MNGNVKKEQRHFCHFRMVAMVSRVGGQFIRSFIHLFYFDSGSVAHKDNTQITIDNKRKTKVLNNRHIVDKWKRKGIYVYDSNNFVLFCEKPFSSVVEIKYFCSTRILHSQEKCKLIVDEKVYYYSSRCFCANVSQVLVKDELATEYCSSILDPHIDTFDGV